MLKLLADESIQLKPSTSSQFNALGDLTVPAIISALIRMTVVVAAIVFFFILVIGGIRWIASGGDKAQTEAARNQITAALVGLVIVFAAWAIVALINTFFKVNIFSLAIPSV
jgi:TRAP-type C4-dicarboxylate transport system permease small subunit